MPCATSLPLVIFSRATAYDANANNDSDDGGDDEKEDGGDDDVPLITEVGLL